MHSATVTNRTNNGPRVQCGLSISPAAIIRRRVLLLMYTRQGHQSHGSRPHLPMHTRNEASVQRSGSSSSSGEARRSINHAAPSHLQGSCHRTCERESPHRWWRGCWFLFISSTRLAVRAARVTNISADVLLVFSWKLVSRSVFREKEHHR